MFNLIISADRGLVTPLTRILMSFILIASVPPLRAQHVILTFLVTLVTICLSGNLMQVKEASRLRATLHCVSSRLRHHSNHMVT